MRLYFVLLIGLLGLLSSCVQRVYSTRETVPALLRNHRSVAVLPFYVRLERPWLTELTYDDLGTTEEGFARQQAAEIDVLAHGLQYALLGQLQRQPGTVRYQSAIETNQLLAKAGIPLDSLNYHSTEELQNILGVDAVLAGDTHLIQFLPFGLSILLLSSPEIGAQPNQIITRLALYDGRTGRLAWRFEHEQTGVGRIVPTKLARELMKRAAPSLPYREPAVQNEPAK